MPDPTFSLVIPTYNREKEIRQTIASVLEQDYQAFEIIVVDDGSTDDTRRVIDSFSDSRLRYFYKANGERGAARNFGTHHSNGLYVTFLDSDDRLHQGFFDEASSLIEKRDSPEIFHLAYDIRDVDLNIIAKYKRRTGDINKALLKGNPLSCIGVFLRKDIAKNNPFVEDRLLSGSEDWELWMRLASKYKIHYSNKVSASLIQHDSRSMLTEKPKSLIQRIELAESLIISNLDFLKRYGSYKNRVRGYLRSYISLHLMAMNKKLIGTRYLISSLKYAPQIIFEKRFLAILLNLLR